MLKALQDQGVTLHGNKAELDSLATDVVEATDEDWTDEYLSFDIAVALVDGVEEAVKHIAQYSTGHTEGIAASDYSVTSYFETFVDSAAVSINTSTAWMMAKCLDSVRRSEFPPRNCTHVADGSARTHLNQVGSFW